ncbi:3-oxoacyl-[acyl-carrier protein] reductase [Bosea sp. BE271]|uniref:SDR family NAD(P)-dependent oxidoreductase n=1 Tax=Bosea TaxID=85413 RepID=UPI00285EAB11|nr:MULTISPECIES: SDR family oxidoreductase [Bosea]MDR6827659.1 3-oxoacyl-[acyl-carrier protein] reductase [Bosea robiniae]MDR6894647.1 3-oxoacyl-[acyl-carrier protein] reductase [Bosea sp. BE109]MDR7137765.1 3-oxoacyl-[acyl-carrier protein] reductase [Bosea sp. BE168]MDR7174464.1 3-oxoacyl-[acyl-carrier protein] reductase [Bosea sp. BE271]
MTISPNRLMGRRAIITGGASGIGLATARQFAELGARVAINYLPGDDQGAAAVVELLEQGFDVLSAPGDVSNPDDTRSMIAGAIAELEGLDYLINNAGTTGTVEPIEFSRLDAMTEEFWQKILSTNLIGPFNCIRAAVDALRVSNGAVVNTASVAGLGIRGSSLAYAASKAALVNLTRNLARALAPEIRVNAVAPGLIETPLTDGWSLERKKQTIDATLLARLGKPAEIAEVIVFLAAQASYINGETVVANGGSA